MMYFIRCVIRRIVNCIIRPKNIFKILALLLILVILFWFVPNFCLAYTPDKVPSSEITFNTFDFQLYLAKNSQYYLEKALLTYYNKNGYNTTLKDIVKTLKKATIFVTCSAYNPYYLRNGANTNTNVALPSNGGTNEIYVYMLGSHYDVMPNNDADVFDASVYSVYKMNANNMTGYYHITNYVFNDGNPSIVHEDSSTIRRNYLVLVPLGLENYRVDGFDEFLNSFDNGTVGLDVLGLLNSIDKNIDETNNKLDEIKEFLKDDTVDENSMSVPSDNTNDVTESGFDNIFGIMQNALTSDEYSDIVIPIPFANKSITIDPDFLYKALGEDNLIITLVSSFTYFFVSLFIVKDVARIIEKIKTGDIATSSETNIKTDML